MDEVAFAMNENIYASLLLFLLICLGKYVICHTCPADNLGKKQLYRFPDLP